MRVGDGFHLGYCSNIHPGETWPEVREALEEALPRVRAGTGASGPLGFGLRLSARAAETLSGVEELRAFREFLRAGDYYVFTINGFPYDDFHGRRVKEQVYLPDWRSEARLEYTNRLAAILSALLSESHEIEGSVSTVPGAFRAHAPSESDQAAIAGRVLRHAAELRRLERETGVTLRLALEPEPACVLETTDDAVAFFEQRLFRADAIAAAARASGLPLGLEDVRRHVGICFDACHAAVEFEDPAASLARLRAAGIRVAKVQVSAALRVRNPANAERRRALEAFAEDTYLHQVVERSAEGLRRFTDLPEALAADLGSVPDEWRVHFHVPIFLESLGDLETTQPELAATLTSLKQHPDCRYLEVETYTWNVLPPEHRASDLSAAIARELRWARERLES
jgi:sugar phosphate isomerase/epimerase